MCAAERIGSEQSGMVQQLRRAWEPSCRVSDFEWSNECVHHQIHHKGGCSWWSGLNWSFDLQLSNPKLIELSRSRFDPHWRAWALRRSLATHSRGRCVITLSFSDHEFKNDVGSRVVYTIYENVVYRIPYIVYNDTYTVINGKYTIHTRIIQKYTILY